MFEGLDEGSFVELFVFEEFIRFHVKQREDWMYITTLLVTTLY
jgi:hypothetical protein